MPSLPKMRQSSMARLVSGTTNIWWTCTSPSSPTAALLPCPLLDRCGTTRQRNAPTRSLHRRRAVLDARRLADDRDARRELQRPAAQPQLRLPGVVGGARCGVLELLRRVVGVRGPRRVQHMRRVAPVALHQDLLHPNERGRAGVLAHAAAGHGRLGDRGAARRRPGHAGWRPLP